MRRAGAGRLVGIASLAGIRGLPGAEAYSASKAAAISYLESLRLELRDSGIKVVTLCPGYIRTPMTEANPFPMPFLMSADEAAAPRFARAIARGRSYAVIPWQMGLGRQSCCACCPTRSTTGSLPARRANRGHHLRIDDEDAGRLRGDEILRLEQHAGIVYENVEAPELATQARRQSGNRARVGDVGDVRQHPQTPLLQFPGSVLDRFGASPDHQHQAPGGGQIPRHREADTPRRAGHNGKFLS
jgi:hypothetical protein